MSEEDKKAEIQQENKDFLDALDALNDLAQAFWEQDEPLRACLTEAQIYESSKKILGPEHPGTLSAMHNYALGLAKTGHDKEAEELLEEYLKVCDKLLEKEKTNKG